MAGVILVTAPSPYGGMLKKYLFLSSYYFIFSTPGNNELWRSTRWSNGHERMLNKAHEFNPDDKMLENSGISPRYTKIEGKCLAFVADDKIDSLSGPQPTTHRSCDIFQIRHLIIR